MTSKQNNKTLEKFMNEKKIYQKVFKNWRSILKATLKELESSE